jgi:hypothetical protein
MAKNGKRKLGYRAAYLFLAGLTLTGSGCLVVAAGATATGGAALTYAYFKGEVSTQYQAALADTWAATRHALAELGMPILLEDWHEDHGTIESRTNHDDKLHISLTTQVSKIPAEGTVTRVGIRVGVFGDAPVSERVLTQIGTHLTLPPPHPLPPVAKPGPIQPVTATGVPPQTPPPPLAQDSAPKH